MKQTEVNIQNDRDDKGSTISISELKEMQNDNMPIRSKRRKSERNTVSLRYLKSNQSKAIAKQMKTNQSKSKQIKIKQIIFCKISIIYYLCFIPFHGILR